MAERLVLDGDELQDVYNALTRIHAEFDQATARSSDAASAVGHQGLADKLTSVASGWKLHRSRMLDALTVVEGHLKGVIDTFDGADRGLAQAQGESTDGASGSGSGSGSGSSAPSPGPQGGSAAPVTSPPPASFGPPEGTALPSLPPQDPAGAATPAVPPVPLAPPVPPDPAPAEAVPPSEPTLDTPRVEAILEELEDLLAPLRDNPALATAGLLGLALIAAGGANLAGGAGGSEGRGHGGRHVGPGHPGAPGRPGRPGVRGSGRHDRPASGGTASGSPVAAGGAAAGGAAAAGSGLPAHGPGSAAALKAALGELARDRKVAEAPVALSHRDFAARLAGLSDADTPAGRDPEADVAGDKPADGAPAEGHAVARAPGAAMPHTGAVPGAGGSGAMTSAAAAASSSDAAGASRGERRRERDQTVDGRDAERPPARDQQADGEREGEVRR